MNIRLSRLAIPVIFSALVLSASPALSADTSSFFVTASVGQSMFKGYELESISDNLDDTDTGYMLHFGYRFGGFFAVSGGYADLGELNASGEGQSIELEVNADEDVFGEFTDTIEAKGWVAWGHGLLPFAGGRAQAYVSLGLFRWDQDVSYRDDFGPFNASASGTDPAFGIGLNWFVGPGRNVSLQAGWHRFLNVGDLDETGHENDIDFFSGSFVYHFGAN